MSNIEENNKAVKVEEEKFLEFLMEYDKYYTTQELGFLVNNFFCGYGKNAPTVASVRSYLNLTPKDKDSYFMYYEFLKNKFDLTKDIVEIGSGSFPTLSYYIDEYQKEVKSGTITAYDPFMVPRNLGNIILKKQNYVSEQKDLYVAKGICASSKIPILEGNKNNKPWSVMLCSCVPKGFESKEDWLNSLVSLGNETKKDNGIIEVSYLDNDDLHIHPIITKSF